MYRDIPKVLRIRNVQWHGEVFLMVYCQKCGADNADDADFCKKCGAPLTPTKRAFEARVTRWGEGVGKRAEEECFGITGGGAIFGIIFGIIIIGLGFSLVYGLPLWLWIGPIVALIFGILIIICALNSVRRKRTLRKQESTS